MHGIIKKILNFLFHYIYFYRILLFLTSVSARWRVPYAVEENLRGMTERMEEIPQSGICLAPCALPQYTVVFA